MARVFKCDICGDVYKQYGYNPARIIQDPNGLKIVTNDNDGRTVDEASYDLCPRCLDSIENYIFKMKRENTNCEEEAL